MLGFHRTALFAASAVALMLPGAALAQARTYNIPQEGLAQALRDYGRQTGVQMIFTGDLVRGRTSPGVRGVMGDQAALAAILAGSGLRGERTPTGVIMVVRDQGPQAGAGVTPAERARTIDEVVVTGTLIRGAPPAGAHIVVMDDKDLIATGRGSLHEMIQTRPENFIGAASEGAVLPGQSGNTGVAFSFGTSLNLRGLGGDATLSLINGRRLAPSGYGDFVDVSVLPVAGVKRVEILNDGASATYGSDALAGVINVILDRQFEGAQTMVRRGVADDLSETRASQLFGKRWSGGHVMAGVEYYKRGELEAADRRFAASGDLRPLGGRDMRLPYSVPGNITSPGIYAGAIPTGQDGLNLRPSDILSGQTNLYDTHADAWILPRQTRYSGFLSASQAIGERVELYADLLASRRKSYYENTAAAQILSVPESNYYRQLNGFTAPGPLVINYNFTKDIGPLPAKGSSKVLAGAAGAKVDLFGSWAADAYVAAGRSREYFSSPYQDIFRGNGALTRALASSDPATAFNPFGDGGDNPKAVVDSLTFPDTTNVRSQYVSANLKLDGDLFTLPGGPVKLALGAEYRKEDFHFYYTIAYPMGAPSSLDLQGDRRVVAGFGELRIPLVGPENRAPGFERLDVSLSGRLDHYSDFGTSANPKVGVTYEPVRGLAFHGSYGTSFKAPRLYDLNTPMGVQLFPAATSYGGPDPNGDGFTQILIVNGGNPDLTAERGDAWTAGVNFQPTRWDGFSADLTYFRLSFRDRISSLPSLLAPLQNPGPYLGSVYFLNPTQAQVDYYVSRASEVTNSLPPGAGATFEALAITQVANVSVIKLDGLDLSVAQRFDTRWGEFTASANFTYYMSYRSQFSPTAPSVTVVDVVGSPVDLRGRVGLGWRRGPWAVIASANYQDDYINNSYSPKVAIKAQTTWDLTVRYEVPDTAPKRLRGLTATVSAVNLFDQDPPFADYGGYGFDTHNATAVGRMISLTLEKRW